MSDDRVIASMSKGWRVEPTGVVFGSEPTGVSGALWMHDQRGVQEVIGNPFDTHHTISIALSSFYTEVSHDGRSIAAKIVRPGDVNLVCAGVPSRSCHSGPVRVFTVALPVALPETLAAQDGLGGVELINPGCTPDRFLERIGREMLDEARNCLPLSRLRIDLLAQDLAIQLLRAHSTLAQNRVDRAFTGRGGLTALQLARVCDAMEASMQSRQPEPGLAELASLAGVTPSHLCRAFARAMGKPPHRWLIDLRIKRACTMLATSSAAISDIASAVGYDDPSYFARLFRKQVGMPPATYRRERRA